LTLPPLIETLLDPICYPDKPATIELVQTHISYLFLTPHHVYKVKKPVDFGFLDFTSLDKRKHFCRQEVDLNRRLSPEVYLDVVEINQKGEKITFGGPGNTIEFAVKMKRLPEEKMMDRLIERGLITEKMVEMTAKRIAIFHKSAATNDTISSFGAPHIIEKNTDENFSQTKAYVGRTITREWYEDIKAFTRDFLNSKWPLFIKRMKEGKVKDCHGDLHSEHVCLTDGVVIFDCIEFNKRFRYSDIIADLAFLAMDLDFHHRPDLSKLLCETYNKELNNDDFQELLSFYKIYRAYVRGKVESFELDEPEVSQEEKERAYKRSRRFFRLAHEFTKGGMKPLIFIVCGIAGSGKSTVAQTLASRTGAHVVSSDILRKEIGGISTLEHRFEEFGKGIYSKELTEKTYREILRRGREHLRKRESVIIDATFSQREQRKAVLELSEKFRVDPLFIECTCAEDVIRERFLKRAEDEMATSDARWEIFPSMKKNYQKIEELPSSAHIVIDTSQPLEENLRKVMESL
jgi:aminoglycoside phosphotransferase family enzyme/predicted kinase